MRLSIAKYNFRHLLNQAQNDVQKLFSHFGVSWTWN